MRRGRAAPGVDLIKVDTSFTAGLENDRTATAVIHGIITMAKEMGVPCLVEGIETQLQHDALVGLGVQGQGWLWGTPRGGDVAPSVPTQRTTSSSSGTVCRSCHSVNGARLTP